MLAQLNATERFLLYSSNLLSAERLQDLKTAQLASLAGSFVANRESQEECGATMQALTTCSCFSQEERTTLANAIAAAMMNSSAAKPIIDTHKSVNQTHLHMHHYLTESDWRNLCDALSSTGKKVETLVQRCLKIGLKFPSEQTVRSIIAIIVATTPREMESRDAYELVVGFKTRLRKLRDAVRLDFLAPVSYPADVIQFGLRGYGSNEPPVVSKLEDAHIETVCASIPARKPNQTLQHNSSNAGAVAKSPPREAAGNVQMMQVVLQLLNNIAPQSRRASELEIRLTPPETPLTPRLGDSGPMLALENGGERGAAPQSLEASIAQCAQALDSKSVAAAAKKLQNKETSAEKRKLPVVNDAQETTSPAKRKRAVSTLQTPAAQPAKPKCEPCPKMPSRQKQAPIEYNGYRIYSDVTNSKWRVKKLGERSDKAFSWIKEPQKQWTALLQHIRANP